MIKAVIIDDEKDARFILRNQLENHFGERVSILGEADDVQSGYDLIEQLRPELVFLDVQMRTGTGFDLLKKFEPFEFEVIFITAYNEFAVQAFKVNAFDYLLKPIKRSELEKSIEKYEQRVAAQKADQDKRIKMQIANYGKGDIQKLIVNNMEGFRIIDINDILRLEGDRNYTHIILLNKTKVTSSRSLGEYEQMLSEYGFFRIHQSTIVSLRYVTGFRKAHDGYVEMIDGSELKVSRSRKQEFIARFD